MRIEQSSVPSNLVFHRHVVIGTGIPPFSEAIGNTPLWPLGIYDSSSAGSLVQRSTVRSHSALYSLAPRTDTDCSFNIQVAMSGVIQRTPENQQIVRRSGPSAGDYVADLVKFLYRRTGFRLENFRAPSHLKLLLEKLSFNRVPLTVWKLCRMEAMSGVIQRTPENQQIVRRSGPSAGDYVADLVKFLYRRTGFRLENFRAPSHLKLLLEKLSFNRVPLTVWNSLLRATLQIASKSTTIGHRLCHFGAFFVDTLCWVFNRLSRMGVLKIAIFLLAAEVSFLATVAISLICYVMEWFSDIFWENLSKFIQSHLITAPYYCHFVHM